MIQFHKKAVIKNRPAWMGGDFSYCKLVILSKA
jgi:hypothetical protein